MYLLDTNVVSELRKAKSGRADPNVVAWAQPIPVGSLFLSAITVLELELGVLLIERRDAVQGKTLRAWLDQSVLPAFEGRILLSMWKWLGGARVCTFRTRVRSAMRSSRQRRSSTE